MNCKLIGQFVQHLEVTLSPGEDFYAEKGSLIYHEAGIERETTLNGNGLGRIIGAKLSGESVFIIRLFNRSSRDLKIVLGSRNGLVPIKMEGGTLICHRGVYVASNNRVDVSSKLSISGLAGGMGLILQKISGYGTVFLDTIGTPITIPLGIAETIEIDENHIIAFHNISEAQIQSIWSLKNLIGGEGLSMMRVTGPGTVYLSPGKFPLLPNQ